MNLARRLLLAFAALASMLLGAFAYYDIDRFQPHRKQMDELSEAADTDERVPPAAVIELLDLSLDRHSCAYAARLLLHRLELEPHRGGMLAWHVTSALWSALVCIHVPKDERTALLVSLAPAGGERAGFAAAARSLYGRDLSELALPELAAIVVLSRAPFLRSRPEQLAFRRDALLARYAAGRN